MEDHRGVRTLLIRQASKLRGSLSLGLDFCSLSWYRTLCTVVILVVLGSCFERFIALEQLDRPLLTLLTLGDTGGSYLSQLGAVLARLMSAGMSVDRTLTPRIVGHSSLKEVLRSRELSMQIISTRRVMVVSYGLGASAWR